MDIYELIHYPSLTIKERHALSCIHNGTIVKRKHLHSAQRLLIEKALNPAHFSTLIQNINHEKEEKRRISLCCLQELSRYGKSLIFLNLLLVINHGLEAYHPFITKRKVLKKLVQALSSETKEETTFYFILITLCRLVNTSGKKLFFKKKLLNIFGTIY